MRSAMLQINEYDDDDDDLIPWQLHRICVPLFAWRFGVSVTTLGVSTKLLYVEPG